MGESPPAAETARGDGLLAAIDLGSNSFHMIVGRLAGGQLEIVDKVRERVRLAAGLDDEGHLDADARERALDCLAAFEQRIREMGEGTVRCVGTNTLRRARGEGDFLREAEEALGHPIEIISGREEARLIHLGATQSLPPHEGHRLLLDVGGGSTELMLGKGPVLVEADSLYMGCVSWSKRFFPDGEIGRKAFREARVAAGVELASSLRRYRALGWSEAVGCSGTANAAIDIGREQGWCGDALTPEALEKIEAALVDAGEVGKIDLDGLAEHRRPVIAGGVAILRAIFEGLGIESLRPSSAALREGVLFDLVGRVRHEDVRDRTLEATARRYAADAEQAARIEATAHALLAQAAEGWELEAARARQLLSWAAHLHEIGLALSHAGYQKHSAYLVEHAEMAGFSTNDQREVAAILRAMRRKMKRAYFEDLPKARREPVLRTALLFRLARTLHRSRSDAPLPELVLEVGEKKGTLRMALTAPAPWLAENALTAGDLAELARALERADVELETRGR